MRIGIIGAGHIGGTLARRFASLGHEVTLANSRGPDSLKEFDGIANLRVATAGEAARSGEVVVVTIPLANVPKLGPELFAGVAEDVVVVDTNNYYPRHRDGRIAEIEEGSTESRWVSRQLGRPVVKAFNNIAAAHLMEKGRPKGTPGRIALPVAGDEPAAKAKVLALVEELGFDAVDAGSIDESWRQQPATPVYGTDLDLEGLRRALTAASPDRLPDWRATDRSPGTLANPT
jgi:8-hydroxy-5-deazaflavin:NADPH oxidoreductase